MPSSSNQHRASQIIIHSWERVSIASKILMWYIFDCLIHSKYKTFDKESKRGLNHWKLTSTSVSVRYKGLDPLEWWYTINCDTSTLLFFLEIKSNVHSLYKNLKMTGDAVSVECKCVAGTGGACKLLMGYTGGTTKQGHNVYLAKMKASGHKGHSVQTKQSDANAITCSASANGSIVNHWHHESPGVLEIKCPYLVDGIPVHQVGLTATTTNTKISSWRLIMANRILYTSARLGNGH